MGPISTAQILVQMDGLVAPNIGILRGNVGRTNATMPLANAILDSTTTEADPGLGLDDTQTVLQMLLEAEVASEVEDVVVIFVTTETGLTIDDILTVGIVPEVLPERLTTLRGTRFGTFRIRTT
jgi:hypothetical protein